MYDVVEGNCSNEVTAVRVEKGYEAVKIGEMEATFKGQTSCCVYKGVMYATGVGEKRDQIWRISLDDKNASQCGRSVCIEMY